MYAENVCNVCSAPVENVTTTEVAPVKHNIIQFKEKFNHMLLWLLENQQHINYNDENIKQIYELFHNYTTHN